MLSLHCNSNQITYTSMQKFIPIITKVMLAFLLTVFGLNKFLGFIQVLPPPDPIAQTFLGAMFGSYLGKTVGAFEIVGGLLLLLPAMSFVGVLVLAPIVFNIVAFHVAHDFIGNGIWLVPTALYILVAFLHLKDFQNLVKTPQQNHAK